MDSLNQKEVTCPKCENKFIIEGKPGKEKFTKCPKCDEIFSEIIPKRKKFQKTKRKKNAIGVTKKQLLAYSIGGFIAVSFIFFIVLPTYQGNLHFLIVLSESMTPNINMGDVVVTSATEPVDIEVGDVITFEQPTKGNPNRCVTHRVVGIINDQGKLKFETKGDANEEADMNPVESDELIGKVLVTIPYIGYIPHYLKTPLGFLLVIVLPGSLLIPVSYTHLRAHET